MKEVYLDNSATTMAYRSVGELVQKVMCEDYGNPSSMHNKGVEAEKYIKEAKETFAIKIIIKNMRNYRGKDVEKIKKRDAGEWWKNWRSICRRNRKSFLVRYL